MYDPHRKRIRKRFKKRVKSTWWGDDWGKLNPQSFEDWINRNFDNRHPCSCDQCCNPRRAHKGRRKAKLTRREMLSLLDLLDFNVVESE